MVEVLTSTIGLGRQDRDLFLDRARLHRQIDLKRAAGRDADLVLDGGLEARQRRRDLIDADGQVEEDVRPPGRGDGRALPGDQGRAGDLDGHARQRIALVVRDRARELPVQDGLGAQRRSRRRKRGRRPNTTSRGVFFSPCAFFLLSLCPHSIPAPAGTGPAGTAPGFEWLEHSSFHLQAVSMIVVRSWVTDRSSREQDPHGRCDLSRF